MESLAASSRSLTSQRNGAGLRSRRCVLLSIFILLCIIVFWGMGNLAPLIHQPSLMLALPPTKAVVRLQPARSDATFDVKPTQTQQATSPPPPSQTMPSTSAPTTSAAAETTTAAPETTAAMPQCSSLVTSGEWTAGWTHPGLEQHRYWATDDGPKGRGFWNTAKSGCAFRVYPSRAIRDCLQNKHIVVIGDSLVRNILNELLRVIYFLPEPLPLKMHEDFTHIFDSSDGTRFTFLWQPTAAQRWNLPSDALRPDHALMGIGVWEMGSSGSYSNSPAQYKLQLLEVLRSMEKQGFKPRGTWTFHPIHNVTRGNHRTCYTRSRVHAFRAAAACAVAESKQPWSMLDFLEATSVAPDVFFDPDWTHIRGTLLEELGLVWLNAMCGSTTGPAAVCSTVDEPLWRDMPRCDFANPS